MRLQVIIIAFAAFSILGIQVHAAPQQVPPPSPDPLAGLAPPPTILPPGLEAINLTQLAPILPLLSQLNASLVATWVPVVERVDPKALEGWVPLLNSLEASTVEAAVAGLVTINISAVLELIPSINALPAATLEGYIKILDKVDSKLVEALLPSIAVLDTNWVNKVVPALNYIDPDYLVAVVKAIAPKLQTINPDQLVALLPAFSKISVATWEKLVELLNKLTLAQLEFLIHLLDVTGPYLDKMVRILNFMRSMLPFDVTTYMGHTTVYTKDKGTTGMSENSVIIAQKSHPTSEPNNGAPPAPAAPAVPVVPVPKTLGNSTGSRRSLLNLWH